MPVRVGYPSDVTDEEWAFVAPYLTLLREDASQRTYPVRAIFNALRYLARTGQAWRYVPNDLPPWQVVYQQWTRWRDARCFEGLVDDLRRLLRVAAGRAAEPTAVILDSRTLQSTPESGPRAGYDGAKRRKGSKVHVAVDTLGHLLAAHVTAANEQDRAQVAALAKRAGKKRCRRLPVSTSPSPTSTKATPGRHQPRRRNGKASNWKWSN